ncbi:uncharacterized protein N7477_009791 [Penicillium maclennaniae]|uniref:uncharacterized protein n=1 Tax=Penicillium maclennaniae TaxID=1343394 RepID=UPI002541FEF8|nr:uncharacterized protein N7477_009791 [Penicillium maclennaniae]KAJ5662175.1 hypothetical protein N7477_009791 [Penicillium maclennaniae]
MPLILNSPVSKSTRAIRLVGATKYAFAVRAGGHATFEGASNINQGLTSSLERLNSVTLVNDGSIAHVGPGNRWYDVYRDLEKSNVTIPGGRSGSVGAAYLFFRQPWILDLIKQPKAVLADGSIVNVNVTSHPNLYWALRGGGANFAIVTRFDIYSIPHEMMWEGIRNYTIDQVDTILDSYVEFGLRASENPSAYQITTLYYTHAKHHATVDLYNTEPEPNPSIFQSLDEARPYADTTSINRQSNISLINALGQPDGLRQTYWTATYKLDRVLAGFVQKVLNDETSQLGDLDGLEARCIMQVITTDILRHMGKNGGNTLGISTLKHPLMLLNPTFRWQNEEDDLKILQANMNLVNRVNARAREMGLDEPFLYMNYASQFQDVIHSYGSANVYRLRMIADRYDPDEVFRTLQPGYFKLSGRVGW